MNKEKMLFDEQRKQNCLTMNKENKTKLPYVEQRKPN